MPGMVPIPRITLNWSSYMMAWAAYPYGEIFPLESQMLQVAGHLFIAALAMAIQIQYNCHALFFSCMMKP